MYKYEGDKAYRFIPTSPPNDAYWTELRKGMIPTFFWDQLVMVRPWFELTVSRSADRHSPNWANWVVENTSYLVYRVYATKGDKGQ